MSIDIKKASFVGFGAVGYSLAVALHEQGIEICDVAVRTQNDSKISFADKKLKTSDITHLLLNVDLVVIAVPDGAISEVVGALADREDAEEHQPLVIHLSGRLGLQPLQALMSKGWKAAAWHPLQSFVKGAGAERFQEISVGITATQKALDSAKALALQIGARPLLVEEGQRSAYHHAAVLISNFIPLLTSLAIERLHEITPTREVAQQALLPLLRGMVDNLSNNSPAKAMTGPVVRCDFDAITDHLKDWHNPRGRELYIQLLRASVELAAREGRLTNNDAEEWKHFLEGVNW
ncbi:DUF2520 domain-containing protein [bacterium]|nr:DUF2520 domain-containing protein [bacterium]